MKSQKYFQFIVFALTAVANFVFSTASEAQVVVTAQGPACSQLIARPEQVARYYKGAKALKFQFPGLQVASVVDPTLSTGATLFLFEKGGLTAFDARGGSVASSETTLLESGSYSAVTDGIVFAGGSTMGLAVGDGVRDTRFRETLNSGRGGDFDFIPSFPTAVVYDYGGRIAPFNEVPVYPDKNMGESLMQALSEDTFFVGRAGAGVTTTVNKVGKERWGGQGAMQINTPVGRVFAAVVLNALGDIVNGDQSLTGAYVAAEKPRTGVKAGRNTTLSIVVTDAKMNRNQLQRLVTMVHSSMAGSISPFHAAEDGDIQFAVSTGHHKRGSDISDEDATGHIAMAAIKAMREAIRLALESANDLKD